MALERGPEPGPILERLARDAVGVVHYGFVGDGLQHKVVDEEVDLPLETAQVDEEETGPGAARRGWW